MYKHFEEIAEAAKELTVKGKIFKQEDDTYKFVVSEDKNGNIPEIQFNLLTSGTPVRILSK